MPPCVAGDETFDLMPLHLFPILSPLCFRITLRRRSDFARISFFDRTDMVSVLMGNEDVPDGRRVDTQPAHFLRKAVVVIARIDHNGRIALAVEEDVRHPLPHTGLSSCSFLRA